MVRDADGHAGALPVTERNDEKILALSEPAKVRHQSAMTPARKYASDAALKNAAAAASEHPDYLSALVEIDGEEDGPARQTGHRPHRAQQRIQEPRPGG